MSEAVLVALIAAVQATTLGVLGILAKRVGNVRRDTTATREQVVNDHTTNFREENDSRHAETRGWFDELRGMWAAVVRDIGGIRHDIRGLRDDDRALEQRIARIEQKETS